MAVRTTALWQAQRPYGSVIAADVPFAALAPLIVVAVGFVAYALVDLARAPSVSCRRLPRRGGCGSGRATAVILRAATRWLRRHEV
jgi:hypothetical protein